MDEKVAVIVLSQDAWEISEKFLHDFRKHTDLEKVKLVWIDNGSYDNTPHNLPKYQDNPIYKIILNDTNLGVIGGRNMGFDWFLNDEDAKDCEYIMMLDNDQFVRKGWLEHHLGVINHGSKYDLIGVEAWLMSSSMFPIGRIDSLKKRFTYVGCGGSMMRRNVPETIGVYDEIFNPSYFEDPDYVFRAHKAGFRIGWNYKARIDHMPHQTLGKATDKAQRFANSLIKFKKKWRKHKAPSIMQPYIPELFDE